MSIKIKKGEPLTQLEELEILPIEGSNQFVTIVIADYNALKKLIELLKNPIGLPTEFAFAKKREIYDQILSILRKGLIKTESYDDGIALLVKNGLVNIFPNTDYIALVDFKAITANEHEKIINELDKLTSPYMELKQAQRELVGREVRDLLW